LRRLGAQRDGQVDRAGIALHDQVDLVAGVVRGDRGDEVVGAGPAPLESRACSDS
jgi:hypothetical protein